MPESKGIVQAASASRKNEPSASNFLRSIVEEDLKSGLYASRTWAGGPGPAAVQAKGLPDPAKIRTRFPPEPNGYLHIGHAKSICLNFGLARDYGGICHLRFDDTNPEKEEQEYVDSIQEDIRWLGFDWKDKLFYASDYFERLFDYAVELIKRGSAYVCDLPVEEVRRDRGDFNRPGKESPFRGRSVDENLDLFRGMRTGEFPDGSRTLRAKIDMSSPNMNMRDPVMYRIKKATHHRTGDKWCIYPMYDYAHPLSDAFEKITHSVCTLEFESHRPLEWIIAPLQAQADRVRAPQPHPHPDEQAQAPRARQPRARLWLERPPHAHLERHAQARLHTRGHPRLLRQDRGHQVPLLERGGAPRGHTARRLEPPLSPRHGGP